MNRMNVVSLICDQHVYRDGNQTVSDDALDFLTEVNFVIEMYIKK